MGASQRSQQDTLTSQDLQTTGTRTLDPQTQAALQQGFGAIAGGLQQRMSPALNLQFQDLSKIGQGTQELGRRLASQQLGAVNLANARRQQQVANVLGRSGSGNNANLLATLAQQGNLAAAGQKNQALGQIAQRRLATGLGVDQARQAAAQAQNAQRLQGRQIGSQEFTPALSALSQLANLGLNLATTGKDVKSTQETIVDQLTKKRSGLLGLF